ncbi:MAG: YcxB family protein [Bacteroidetes bacterium]|nr:YcxB family protein [Bacteroidota bacterium]
MNISIKLEVKDWYQFQSYLEKEIPKTMKSWTNSFWFNLVLWAVLGFVFMLIFQNTGKVHWPTVGVVSTFFILMFALFVFNLYKYKRACAPSKSGVFIGEHRFIFDEEGIKAQGQGYESSHNWTLVQRIERANGIIIIFLDTAYAYIFPESKLENPEQLYNYINEQYKKI